MRDEVDNEKLLVRYLLRSLPEEEQLEVEGMFLSNDQYYERLLALENELFYDYAQGKLSPGERHQFEKHFLTSERNRRKATFASALAQKMSEAAPGETARPHFADRKAQSPWQSLKSRFSLQSVAVRFSLAALAVVLLGSSWLVIEIVRLRTELDQLRAERTDREERLQQQTQQERARADELNLQLARELDENAMLKQELNKVQDGQGERLPSVFSFVLAPSFVRGEASSLKKLYVPPGMRMLNLQLNLKEEVEYQSYQATLLTAEGIEKWNQNRLRATRRGSGQAIVLKLPAGALEEGDYELRLKGLAPDGTLEETGEYYYFTIVKK
jgi:hypothetical protein